MNVTQITGKTVRIYGDTGYDRIGVVQSAYGTALYGVEEVDVLLPNGTVAGPIDMRDVLVVEPGVCETGGREEAGTWREDPYEADVNNTPGVMIQVCDRCYQETSDGI